LFSDQEWGGANALYPIDNEHVGVLGHVAFMDKKLHRHYYSMSFILTIPSFNITNYTIIAKRKDFKAGKAKRIDLYDVIFSGGLDKITNNRVNLYVGVSDSHAQCIRIKNPFSLNK
ncbi:MAG: DUF1861 family protein, partial [Bacilli bacterium]